MAIFTTDSASVDRLEVSSSLLVSKSLSVVGSGPGIFTITGSFGSILEVGETTAAQNALFAITSASIELLTVNKDKSTKISGSLHVTGSVAIAGNVVASQLTGSLQAFDLLSADAVGGASVKGAQSAINALSNRISAIPGGGSAPPTRYVSVANTIANNVLTGISGLTVSVSAGVIYDIDGAIMYSVSAATGNAFGMIWPTANRVAGVWAGGISVNETGASTFSTMAFGNFDTGDSNSAVWSATVGAAGLHYIRVEGTIDVQTGGAVYPLVRSSAAANTVVVARGSFFKLTRIN